MADSEPGQEFLRILAGYVDRPTLQRELGVSAKTLQRYEQLRDGLPSVSIGGRKFYRVEAVREFIARRERKPNPVRRAG